MGATLYAALIMHSYIMSLICCGIQVRCTWFCTWFMGSYTSCSEQFQLRSMSLSCGAGGGAVVLPHELLPR